MQIRYDLADMIVDLLFLCPDVLLVSKEIAMGSRQAPHNFKLRYENRRQSCCCYV